MRRHLTSLLTELPNGPCIGEASFVEARGGKVTSKFFLETKYCLLQRTILLPSPPLLEAVQPVHVHILGIGMFHS